MTVKASKRILVAEDNDIEALILVRLLTGVGYQVDRAKDGAEAFDKYLNHTHYDLLLTDIMMPGLSGMELIRLSKETGKLPPTIVLTANKGDEAVLKSLGTGALDHLTKPVNASLVIAKVQLLIGKP